MISEELKSRLWTVAKYAQDTIRYEALDDKHFKTCLSLLLFEIMNIQNMKETKEMMKEE
tara:strand:- start:2499 stop:2675 length:177 start_codon:yes stop_codon:yes gene_type:complete